MPPQYFVLCDGPVLDLAMSYYLHDFVQTTQIKSLEKEIVRLHHNDEEHKEFAAKLVDAEKAREASEANLLILRADKTETENKLLMEIQQFG